MTLDIIATVVTAGFTLFMAVIGYKSVVLFGKFEELNRIKRLEADGRQEEADIRFRELMKKEKRNA